VLRENAYLYDGNVSGQTIYAYVGGNPVSNVDPLGLFNPTKALSALGNASIAGYSAGAGGVKIAAAVGLSPAATTGVGALPPLALLAWGSWNLKSSMAAWQRARTQWNQAMCEDWSQASWQNFYGMLPGGTNYDDSADPYSNPMQYIQGQGWWNFISNFGYF
jgi:hypothetical protein